MLDGKGIRERRKQKYLTDVCANIFTANKEEILTTFKVLTLPGHMAIAGIYNYLLFACISFAHSEHISWSWFFIWWANPFIPEGFELLAIQPNLIVVFNRLVAECGTTLTLRDHL